MGEAIIARGQTASKNVLDDIPVSSGYCSILLQLKDSAGKPCENTKINCKDGSRWYNYTTNEAGYVLFKCNSGAANITASNRINGYNVYDQAVLKNINYDAPVGTKILKEVKFNKISHFDRKTSGWFNGYTFRVTNTIKNLILVGGGGGGNSSRGSDEYGWGGGGGAKEFYSELSVTTNQYYNIFIGEGGNGVNGNSGGTSTAFGYSAMGGSLTTGGIGMYNGGKGARGYGNGYDGVNGAGGGGGAGSWTYNGGNNGGGRGGYFLSYDPDSGDRGGSGVTGSGGGGGAGADKYEGGSGGSGRIEFDM